MFNSGEIGIFERLGMRPAFIGESVVGPRQPNITYMLSFDSLAEREKHWQAFGSDPEWKKLSAPPELKDAQIVSNISNTMWRPLPFSPLR
jgi:NIPSNAP